MADNLELVALGDPLHFSSPVNWAPRWSRELTVPALMDRSGWSTRTFDIWQAYEPRDAAIPTQGWKIHVSATVDNASRILHVVGGYCARHGITFKHVRTLALVAAANGRSAARSSSGKSIAIYPRDVTSFLRIADDLALLLENESGPYVLSDRRWAERAPVYFRYGAFVPLQTWTEDGRRVAARFTSDGRLVEDQRSVPFRLPEDVDVPARVLERATTFTEPPVMPVRITEAIQHSGCGGVYRGILVEDGTPVVVKEARPHTGGSPDVEGAMGRLRHEAGVLHDLSGRGAPRLRAKFFVDTHLFVASEEIPGASLRHWVAAHHPLLHPGARPEDLQDYARRSQIIADAIAEALDAMHAAGWAHNDLHPGNVIVRPDLSVALTDLEFAAPPEDTTVPAMACSGFAVQQGTAAERDHFALDMTRAFLLHPVALGALVELDPRSLQLAARDASEWFGAGSAAPVARAADRYLRVGRCSSAVSARTGHQVATAPAQVTEADLFRYLRAVATPDRDLLVPGDPEALTGRLAALSVAHGASGVVLAMIGAGRPVPSAWRAHFERLFDAPPSPMSSPGLWDGWAGVALAWHALGDLERAEVAMSRVEDAWESCTDPTLATGIAGSALARLTLAPDLMNRTGADTARRLLDELARDIDHWGRRCRSVGLLTGATGVGAALARAALVDPDGPAVTDHPWLTASRSYLLRDLAECRPASGAALDLVAGDVGLPYLGAGSLGLALAIATLRSAEHRPPERTTGALARSGQIELMVEPGLQRGRLGVAFALDRLARSGQVERPDQARRWRDGHLQLLGRHGLRVDDGVGLLGSGSARLSADLATGAAGALAVLSAIRSDAASPLDLLLAAPAAKDTSRRRQLVSAAGGRSHAPATTGRR